MKKYLFLSVIALLLFSCSTSKKISLNHSWIDIAVIEDLEVYTDTLSIKYKQDGYTYAWVKTTYTQPESRKSYIDKIRKSYPKQDSKLDEKMKKWDNFYYNISYRAYDCSNKRYKTLQVTDYTSDNKEIITTKPPKGTERWVDVGIDTMGDYTLFYICDYGN